MFEPEGGEHGIEYVFRNAAFLQETIDGLNFILKLLAEADENMLECIVLFGADRDGKALGAGCACERALDRFTIGGGLGPENGHLAGRTSHRAQHLAGV